MPIKNDSSIEITLREEADNSALPTPRELIPIFACIIAFYLLAALRF